MVYAERNVLQEEATTVQAETITVDRFRQRFIGKNQKIKYVLVFTFGLLKEKFKYMYVPLVRQSLDKKRAKIEMYKLKIHSHQQLFQGFLKVKYKYDDIKY